MTPRIKKLLKVSLFLTAITLAFNIGRMSATHTTMPLIIKQSSSGEFILPNVSSKQKYNI